MINIPRLRLISGRYFWRPTPATKKLGFAAEALGADMDKAIARARELNAQVDAVLAAPPSKPSIVKGSVTALIADYERSDRCKGLAPKTRHEYGLLFRRIERVAGRLSVARLDRKGIKTTYKALREHHTLSVANAMMRAWQVLLTHAYDDGWLTDNLGLGLRIIGVAARTRLWSAEEIEIFCAAAEKDGRASMALAVRLAHDIGQRQADVLKLQWNDWDGVAVTVAQNKTGAVVRVPMSPDVAARLNGAKKRGVQIIVSEATAKPYKKFHFSHEFARLRALAGLPKDLQFRDLRRTAATELGNAGATDDEIRSVTGHRSRGSVAVYVRPTGAMAGAAQGKRQRNKKAAPVAKVSE